MQNPVGRLRFKVGTSFAIAVLGAIAFIRLLGAEPLSSATAMPFVLLGVLIAAGMWRGLIYWQAMRSLAKS